MEKFIVSARKYRPQNFSTVVGQAHITTTLKNAINNNQLAHAFLFCGPRGVGKTTCARILAKTINCENRQPDGEACNECPSCISFNEGASMNIHELDAASNNSVDDIRALVEQVRFAPQAGKYKVYIIDEVHMLTSQAFNAFLKTLEEPPSYAIFILATTEKHKILPTILSRCQIFDFKRITTNDTVQHLEEICGKEEISTERPALQIIAQKSEGCMRDALSILDKIVSFTNGSLTYQNTLEHLNILDADYYFKLMDMLLNQDLPGALLLYDDINKKGFEGDLVLNGFAEFLRNLLVAKDSKAAALLDVLESFKPRYTAQAAGTGTSYLISALNILNESEINYRAARNKRLHVELTLIKLCYLQQALELSSSSSGLTKKKIVENTRPLAFRNLSMAEMKELPSHEGTAVKGSPGSAAKGSPGSAAKGSPEARLVIHSGTAGVASGSAVKAETGRAEFPGAETTRAKAAGTEATRMETTGMEATRTETARMGTAGTEATRAETTRMETAGTEATKAETARMETVGTGTVKVPAGDPVKAGDNAMKAGSDIMKAGNDLAEAGSNVAKAPAGLKAGHSSASEPTGRKSTGKLSALTRIREQIAHENGHSGQKASKALTPEELKDCWETFAEKLREEKNPAEQSFKLAELRITGANNFEVITGNNLEYRFIEQCRVNLVEHVQGWFNNQTLSYSILTEVKEDRAATVEAPLSSRQQYQKLAEEYPLVKELRDRLRLELDY